MKCSEYWGCFRHMRGVFASVICEDLHMLICQSHQEPLQLVFIQSSFEKLQNQIKIRKMANWWPYELVINELAQCRWYLSEAMLP